MVICDFCNGQFSNKNALSLHQKNAKYCLLIQGKESKNKCDKCNKLFSSKKRLEGHIKICVPIGDADKIKKLEEKVELLTSKLVKTKQKCAKLKSQIDGLTTKYNIAMMTSDYIKNCIPTLEELSNSSQGIMDFGKRIFSNYVICSDSSRKTFRMNINRTDIVDFNGRYLRKLFFGILGEHIPLLKESQDNLEEDLYTIDKSEDFLNIRKDCINARYMFSHELESSIKRECKDNDTEIGDNWIKNISIYLLKDISKEI